ncbi:MAG: DUF433 domain-containing protein [Nitrospiria bacterium]
MPKISHPHIIIDQDICGGSPVIAKSRFPVRSVVVYILRYGLTPEELAQRFPHISLGQIHDALAYYYDNREEVEKDIAENTEEFVKKKFSI